MGDWCIYFRPTTVPFHQIREMLGQALGAALANAAKEREAADSLSRRAL